MSQPEQRLKSRFASLLGRKLQKGSFMLQLIETGTGVGVPDIYLSFDFSRMTSDKQREQGRMTSENRSVDNPAVTKFDECQNADHCTMWIEAKTLDYKVDRFQLNWAKLHWKAGGLTYILTTMPAPGKAKRLQSGILQGSPGLQTNLPHTNPYHNKLDPLGSFAYPTVDLLPKVFINLFDPNTSNKKEGDLILISFDDAMLDYSSLGRYLAS